MGTVFGNGKAGNAVAVDSKLLSEDKLEQAKIICERALKLGIAVFTLPRDICSGNERLTMLFLSQLHEASLICRGVETVEIVLNEKRQPICTKAVATFLPGRPLEMPPELPVSYSRFCIERHTIQVPPVTAGPAVAFARYINLTLADNADVREYLPLNEYGNDLFERVKDGVLLAELINAAAADAVRTAALTKGSYCGD
jgi:hypothetical protein